MTEHDPQYPGGTDSGTATIRGIDAGDMLREAREAAGFSLEVVSQQLKLAPRQVKALEDCEFGLLPGRTFVRGFARNYARLLHLDPQVVLDALPGGAGSNALEAPPLHATAITIGHLPSAAKGGSGWLRWALPLLIIAAVAAGTYQYLHGDLRLGSAAPKPVPNSPALADQGGNAAANGGSALPTPVFSPVTPDGNAAAARDGGAPGAEAGKASVAPVDGAAIAPVILVLRGTSWIEVKDGTGRVVVSQMIAGGQTQSVVGAPPFDVVIGNAPAVSLSFRGQAVDLGPYTRQNVARLTLQ